MIVMSPVHIVREAIQPSVSRVDLQDWIEVFEQADLPLCRVDWLLHAACQGMLNQLDGQHADLAWMISTAQTNRLLLIRDGVPEVDRSFAPAEPQLWGDVLETTEHWCLCAQILFHCSGTGQGRFTRDVIGFVAWADHTLVPWMFAQVDCWNSTPSPTLLDPLISLALKVWVCTSNSMTDSSIDLLGRSVELGLASTAPAFHSTKALLLKGGLLAELCSQSWSSLCDGDAP